MPESLSTKSIPSNYFALQPFTTYAWLGMAGLLLNARGTVLLVDPLITLGKLDGAGLCEGIYKLKVPLPIETRELPRVDAVLYTHADDDHFGLMTARLLIEKFECQFIAPPPILRTLQEMGAPVGRLVRAEDFATLHVGVVAVQVTPALHDWQEQNPWQRGDCCGYLLKTPDGTIWHPGDTRLIPELLEIKGVDVLLFDVAAVDAHLGPQGSARLAASCGARLAIAYHYGTFDLPPGSFASFDPQAGFAALAGLPVDYRLPDPGEVLRLP